MAISCGLLHLGLGTLGDHHVAILWHGIPDETFFAGGIAMQSATRLLLGMDAILYSYELGDPKPIGMMDVSGLGISHIDGMAIHPTTRNLLLIDGEDQELVEIANWE